MTANKTSLKISQFINAKPQRVYEAWITGEHLCPEECKVISNKGQVVNGGSYRSSMKCGSEVYTVSGEYHEVIANAKLIFTHQWADEGSPQTLVTVEFKNKNGGTELILSQTGFNDLGVSKGHEKGWSSALNGLAKFVQSHGSSKP